MPCSWYSWDFYDFTLYSPDTEVSQFINCELESPNVHVISNIGCIHDIDKSRRSGFVYVADIKAFINIDVNSFINFKYYRNGSVMAPYFNTF